MLAVRGEEVKLRLEIDKDDGLAEPHWYPFAPPTGSAMYCLPQAGTKASLYHPDATGSGALIVGTVRNNGGDCAKTGDTNTRYFGTEHGSELKLAPSHVNLQKDPEGAMLVSLNDETGIEITSPGKQWETDVISVEQSVTLSPGGEAHVKEAKTKGSKRKVAIPSAMLRRLQEYRSYKMDEFEKVGIAGKDT
ncbi:hypothetical protein D3C74_40400 [compost metagenome]